MRYRLVKIGAWAALLWERLWRAVWPAAALALGLLALTLLGVWQALPPIVGGVALALYLAVSIVALGAGLLRVRPPSRAEALRWLEIRNGLKNRPLTLAEDRQATPASPASALLWQHEKEAAAAKAGKVRAGLPHPGVAARDPWALRVLVTLFLFVGILIGGQHWQQSLAFLMDPPFGYPQEPATVTAWLDPPQYTGKPPRTLSPEADEGAAATIMAVPAGTKLNIRVQGPRRTPILDAVDGRRAMREDGKRAYVMTYDLKQSGDYSLNAGGVGLASWRFDVTADKAPKIAFAGPPSVTARDSLHLRFEVEDDYGATKAQAVFTRTGSDDAIHVDLPIGPPRPGKETGEAYANLTAHPWAGTSVLLTLHVKDAAGQEGTSKTLAVTLPERKFTHPVAKEIIALRKRLVTDPESGGYVSRRLGLISIKPKAFNEDLVAYMAIRAASYRALDGDKESHDEAVSLMWDTAVRIEDGQAGLAEAKMRDAMQAMMDALSSQKADSQKLNDLMQKLQQAMQDYMQALAKQQKGQKQTQSEANSASEDRQSLSQMMQQIKNLTQLGSLDDARKMLSQLQSMMENMKTASPEQQAQQRQMEGLRQKLKELRQRQQQLMDETFKASQSQGGKSQKQQQGGGPGNKPQDPSTQSLGSRQGDLKNGLMTATQQTHPPDGRGSQSLNDASNAMSEAQKQISQGQLQQAVQSQAQAIQSLSNAEQSMGQQQGQGQAQNRGRGDDGNQGMGESDPNKTVVPTEGDLGRARAILDEIRRRAGEWQRPDVERKYLDRLLERF